MRVQRITGKIRRLFALALCALLPAAFVPAAASVPDFTEADVSSDFRDLVPGLQALGAACERDGIRVELLQGVVQDDRALLVFSIQDLAGDRVSPCTSDCISLWDVGASDRTGYRVAGYDEARHRVVVVQETRFLEPVQAGDREVTLSLQGLLVEREAKIDLVPYVQEYATEATGIDVPELIPLWADSPEAEMERRRAENGAREALLPSMKVLDYTQPLDVPVYGDRVFLTGAGWIGGMLHLQFRFTDSGKVYYGSNESWYYPLFVSFPQGVWSNFSGPGFDPEAPEGASPLLWDVTGDGKEDWAEYLIPCRPEDVGSTGLAMTVSETTGWIDETWEFTLPLSAIHPESLNTEPREAGTAAAPEDDREVTELLEAFFRPWSENDVESMLGLCAPSWVSLQQDPKLELFRLLANRTPLNWSVVMIHGSAGDSVRTAVLDAVIDRNNGKPAAMYRLDVTLVREDDGRWYVDPQCLLTYESAGTSAPEATFLPEPTATPQLYPGMVLYYNPAGGELYHLDRNCEVVADQWRPLDGRFTWAEADEEAYRKLQPCPVCGAPARK